MWIKKTTLMLILNWQERMRDYFFNVSVEANYLWSSFLVRKLRSTLASVRIGKTIQILCVRTASKRSEEDSRRGRTR